VCQNDNSDIIATHHPHKLLVEADYHESKHAAIGDPVRVCGDSSCGVSATNQALDLTLVQE
jgi:hypothetical protein